MKHIIQAILGNPDPFIQRKALREVMAAQVKEATRQGMRDIIEQQQLSSAEPTDVNPSIYRGTL